MIEYTNIWAVDDGFFHTKVYAGLGCKFSIVSRARIGTSSTFSFLGGNNAVEYVTDEGHVYSVGAMETDSIANDLYHGSVLNRVLVNHSLICAGAGGQNVKLCTGLPLRNYFIGEAFDKNQALIDSKQLNFSKPLYLRSKNENGGFEKIKGSMPTIISNHVLPQGLAVWYDYIIDETPGKPNEPIFHSERKTQDIAIIDIGGRTTDIAVVSDSQLDKKSCVSPKCGIHDIYDNLRDLLSNRIPPEVLNMKKIDACMQSKEIFYSGEKINIEQEIIEATNMVTEKLRSIINSAIGDKGKAIENILFVGGGSQALYPYLNDIYKHQILVDDAPFANAKGMYKAMKFVMNV